MLNSDWETSHAPICTPLLLQAVFVVDIVARLKTCSWETDLWSCTVKDRMATREEMKDTDLYRGFQQRIFSKSLDLERSARFQADPHHHRSN